MTLIIKSGRRLFLSKKQNRFPIIKDILKKITEDKSFLVVDLNVDMIFKILWTGFISIGELTGKIDVHSDTGKKSHICKERS